ncbi:MAG: HlyD family type I secretion periplasmic adaptor subunit [Devosia sp.]|nr:HlyD family type I secretion periplasmic adaptor subunit [Devosia sp.]
MSIRAARPGGGALEPGRALLPRHIGGASLRARDVLPGVAPFRSLKRMLAVGVLFTTVPFIALLGAISLMPIPGATIANGYLTSESSPKEIQSPVTAVVRAILVNDGDLVHAGQQLMELDDTAAKSELAIASRTRDQSAARIARLNAEALNLKSVSFPAELADRASDPDIAAMMKAETELFDVRLQAYQSQLDQMQDQATQIDAQVRGVNGQLAAANQQYDLLVAQVANLQKLRQQALVSQSQLTQAQQDLSVVDGQRAQYNSTIATAKAKQAELRGGISELIAKRMGDAAEQQRETQAQYDEASQKQIADTMAVQQYQLTSPQDGVVTDLRIRTVGGVVNTSETLMTVVPRNDRLIAELSVSPRDASKIHVGQAVELHFSASGGATAPQFSGAVLFVAPDLVYDQRTGVPHFVVRTSVKDPLNEAARELKQLGSGMPVDVYVLSAAQPIISYISRPIIEQAERAFR